jgi:hypothetical protein
VRRRVARRRANAKVCGSAPRASSMRFSFRFGEENITTRERAMEYDHADSLASRSSCSHGASPTW